MSRVRFTFQDTSAFHAEELAASLEGWLADVEPRGSAQRMSSSTETQSAGDVVEFMMKTVVSGMVAGVSQVAIQEVYNHLRINEWRSANGNPAVSIEVLDNGQSSAAEEPPSKST